MTETLKVRFERGTQIFDKKRAAMISVAKGEEVELDIEDQENRLSVWEIICSDRVVITDGRIPASAQYLVLHTENYVRGDGTRVTLFPGKEITLGREVAARFLVSGHIRPVDQNTWRPSDLIRPRGAINTEAKKMYDEEPAHENFALTGFKRER